MKKNIFKIISICLIFNVSGLFSQSKLETNIIQILNLSSGYGEEFKKNYLRGYMTPFASTFGIATGGAMFYRASTKNFPRFDIGISAVYVSVSEDDRKFRDTQDNIVPTIFGNENHTIPNSSLPGGIGEETFLVPQLHINLGLVSNFEATVRYLVNEGNEFGKMSFIGFGVKYGFGEVTAKFPLDLSVQAMYHKFYIDEWLDSGTIGMNIQMSKALEFIPLDFYGGIGFENTTMLIKTQQFPSDNISTFDDISIEGKNNYRLNLGLSWTLMYFNAHVDYNFGYYNSLSLGAMLTF